jgi:hypothetical protein
MNSVDFITKEHMEYVHKQIMKALKNIDWEEYVSEYIEMLFEQSSTDTKVIDTFSVFIVQAVNNMLVKKGLIKPEQGLTTVEEGMQLQEDEEYMEDEND